MKRRDDEHAADAWERFCEELKRAGDVLRRSTTPQDALTQAEGLRFLVSMLGVGFENACEIGDVTQPRLIPMIAPGKLYEGVTADARYLHCFIDGTATHHIAGTRGGAPLIELSVYTGKAGIHPDSRQLGALTEHDLVSSDTGRIEVVLSPNAHPDNWLRTSAEASYVMIRQYAHDWSGVAPAQLTIRREGAAARPAPLSMHGVVDGLAAGVAFAERAPAFWAAISDYWEGFAVNRFVAQLEADQRTDIASPTGHHFSCGWFRLEPGEALIATFRPSSVPYWSLGLANYWYETLGFDQRGSEVNNRTADVRPDGSVRIVIADAAPRGANWLDARHHREGTMIFRWSRSTEPVPTIETELVRLRDLEETA